MSQLDQSPTTIENNTKKKETELWDILIWGILVISIIGIYYLIDPFNLYQKIESTVSIIDE